MTQRTPAQYDWTNALFNDRRLTKNFTSPRRGKISHVTLHHMTIVAPASQPQSTVAVEGAYRTWMGGRAASANYGVSGELVWQYVSDFDAAWSDANSTSNNSTLSIEHANSSEGPGWQISDATMQTGARLVATLHRLYGLGRPTRKTVRVHRDYYATACPGPYMMAHLDAYIATAAKFYDGEKPSPEPAPTPTPTTVEVVSATQNFAGNNARGVATASKRIPRYVAQRKATPVHVVNAQECTLGSTVRPRLDSGLKPLGYTRNDGGKGRYTYTRGVKVIAHGLITTPSTTWYQRDDKQASWVIYELDGAIGMDVSLHLESNDAAAADAKRVAQGKYIATSALTIAKAHGCPETNVLLTGDTNSEGMVVAALIAAGWRNAAAGTPFENAYTFMGWDGLSRKRFDYALVRHDAAPAKVVALTHDTTISDHGGLRVVRQLTK